MTLTSPLSPWAKMRSITVSWILVLASCLVIQYGFLNDSFENAYPRLSSHACSSVMPVPPDSDSLSSSWSAFHVVSRLICVSPLFSFLNTTHVANVCLPTWHVNSKACPRNRDRTGVKPNEPQSWLVNATFYCKTSHMLGLDDGGQTSWSLGTRQVQRNIKLYLPRLTVKYLYSKKLSLGSSARCGHLR